MGGEIGGFEIVRDLVDGLPDPGVVPAHVGGWRVGLMASQLIGGEVGYGCSRSF